MNYYLSGLGLASLIGPGQRRSHSIKLSAVLNALAVAGVISVPSSTDTSYILEYKDSLLAGNWSALPAVGSSGGVLTLIDPVATNAQRFYRVRVASPDERSISDEAR